jgi:hypothetical protein
MVLNEASISTKHELFWNLKATYFFATKIGDDEYLQMFTLSGDHPSESDWKKVNVNNYIFAKYKIIDEPLTIWTIDYEAAANAVKGGKLKGTVEKPCLLERIVLKESSEGLRRFLQIGGNKSLFPDRMKMTLERVERTR